MDNLFSLLLNGLLIISILSFIALMYSKFTKEQSVFKSMSIVTLVLTTIYALILSSFNSYLLILFIFLVYAIFRNIIFKHKKSLEFRSYKINVLKEWLLILFYFLVSFFLLNIQIILQDNIYIDLHPDFSFYAGVSEILSRTGIETTNFDIALQDKQNFVFYHYFELWFNALVSEFLNITHLKGLMFITIPIFATIMLRGVFELQQKLFNVNKARCKLLFYILPLSILFLFPYTITFRWLMSFGENFTPWNTTIASSLFLKWIIVLAGLVYLFIDYKKNKYQNTIMILAFIGIVYPTTIISILPSIIIFMFIFRKKMIKLYWLDVVIVTITILSVFWKVNQLNVALPEQNLTDVPSTLELVKQFFSENPKNLFIFIKEPVLRTLYIIIAFAPLILLLLPKRREIFQVLKKHFKLLVLLLIIYFISLSGLILLNFTKDGEQLYTNIFYPFFILMMFLGFLYIIVKSSKKIRIIGAAIFALTIVLNLYGVINEKLINTEPLETENVLKISEHIRKTKGKAIIIADEGFYSNTRRKNIYFIIPGHNLRYLNNNYFPQTVSLDRIDISSKRDTFDITKRLMLSMYYKDVLLDKRNYQDIIKTNQDIKLIIIDKNAPEFDNSEENFNLSYLGKIDDFYFYKRK